MEHPLTHARRRAGLSQKALAGLVEKDRVTISRIETRQQRASIETISKIIAVLKAREIELSADAFVDLPADLASEVAA